MKKVFLTGLITVSVFAATPENFFFYSNFTNKIDTKNATSKVLYFGTAEKWYQLRQKALKAMGSKSNGENARIAEMVGYKSIMGAGNGFLQAGSSGGGEGGLIGLGVSLLVGLIHKAIIDHEQANQFIQITEWKTKDGNTSLQSTLFLTKVDKYINKPSLMVAKAKIEEAKGINRGLFK